MFVSARLKYPNRRGLKKPLPDRAGKALQHCNKLHKVYRTPS